MEIGDPVYGRAYRPERPRGRRPRSPGCPISRSPAAASSVLDTRCVALRRGLGLVRRPLAGAGSRVGTLSRRNDPVPSPMPTRPGHKRPAAPPKVCPSGPYGHLYVRQAVFGGIRRRIRGIRLFRGLYRRLRPNGLRKRQADLVEIRTDAEHAEGSQQDGNDDPFYDATEDARRSFGHGPILADR